MIGILKKILLVVSMILITSSLLADEPEWLAVESVAAKKKAEDHSSSVFAVRKGSVYPVLGKTKNGWLKVRSNKDAQKVGFVRVGVLRPPEQGGPKKARRGAAGLTATYSMFSQAGRNFNDASPAVEISSLSSSTLFFGVFYRFALAEPWRLRAGLNMRSLDLKGTTKVASGSVSTTPSNLRVQQDFFGISLIGEYWMGSSFWVGAGLEAAQATKSTVTTTEQIDQPEKPLYVVVQALAGIEFSFGRFFVAPEVRAQVIPNSTPMMMGFEVSTLLGMKF